VLLSTSDAIFVVVRFDVEVDKIENKDKLVILEICVEELTGTDKFGYNSAIVAVPNERKV
jgi:hypothetical protein